MLTIFTLTALATAGVLCRQWCAGKYFNSWLSGERGRLSILTTFDHGVNIPFTTVFRVSARLSGMCDREEMHTSVPPVLVEHAHDTTEHRLKSQAMRHHEFF